MRKHRQRPRTQRRAERGLLSAAQSSRAAAKPESGGRELPKVGAQMEAQKIKTNGPGARHGVHSRDGRPGSRRPRAPLPGAAHMPPSQGVPVTHITAQSRPAHPMSRTWSLPHPCPGKDPRASSQRQGCPAPPLLCGGTAQNPWKPKNGARQQAHLPWTSEALPDPRSAVFLSSPLGLEAQRSVGFKLLGTATLSPGSL